MKNFKYFLARMILPVLLIFTFIGSETLALQPKTVSFDPETFDHLNADELVQKALIDTLYYDFDKWFVIFQNRIDTLKSKPTTVKNQIDLMKFHFFLSGLYVELSHVMAFNSKFRVDSVSQGFNSHMEKAQKLAQRLLERDDISEPDQAVAYLYLGAAEGYLGIFQYNNGKLLKAVLNGFSADNHLEEALKMDPGLVDAHLGLGIYRYGNSRVGGIGNFIMQGGKDLRLTGLQHLERTVRENSLSKPLAIKTLIWFYIAEEINPENRDLPSSHPLSREFCRKKVLQWMDEYEKRYFQSTPPSQIFNGNKGLAMMKAIQAVLDEDYEVARDQFEKVAEVTRFLIEKKEMRINPQLIPTANAGVNFSEVMIDAIEQLNSPKPTHQCLKINKQINFIDDGGSLVDYDSKQIRKEIQDVFYNKLVKLSNKLSC